MSDKNTITPSSGNVFADLGFENADEEQMKAELVRNIREIIEDRGLTQNEAGRLLGVDQPKVSALLRGNLAGFSTERLFRFLKALDRDVEISIKRRPKNRPGRVMIVPYAARKAG